MALANKKQLDSIEQPHSLGFDFIAFPRGLKGPKGMESIGWQLKPKKTIAELRAAGDCNYGIRLGGWSKVGDRVLVGLDVDIRTPEAIAPCHAWLDEFVPEWRALPSVISGSGGESRHIYGTFSMPPTGPRTVMGSGDGWNVDVRGNEVGRGCLNVWAGSLHPSGGIYTFERPIDVARITAALADAEADMIGCEFPTGLEFNAEFEREVFEKIGAPSASADDFGDDSEDWLEREAREGKFADYTIEQARIDISAFPQSYWDARDTWVQCGMALKHDFPGNPEAFELWCEFGSTYTGFTLREAQQEWRSYKKTSGQMVTMGTIRAESKSIQIKAAFGGDEAAEEPEGLISDVPVEVAPLAVAPPAYLVAPLPHDEDWRDRLVKVNKAKKAKDGDPEPEPIWVLTPGLTNTRIIIQRDIRLRDTFAYNSFAQSVVLVRDARRKKAKPGQPCYQLEGVEWKLEHRRDGDIWSDSREHDIRAMIETPTKDGGYSLKIADRDMHSAVDKVAKLRRFHPVQEFIKAETWDGVPRMRTMLIDFLGCPDTPYHREISRLTLLAAVTRIFEPGHKWDYVPIIEGAQGKGKSTFISVLAHNWFSELANDFTDDKKMVESMKGSWIIEIGELSGFTRHEVGIIKQFITRVEDKVRMAYAHHVSLVKRQCIFIGSTNDRRYLRDETGGRRFWPVVCNLPGQIDNFKLRAIVGQLWAEAYAMYQQLRAERPDGSALPLYLTDPAAVAEAEELQESRRVETADDAMLGQIQRWLDTPIKGDGMDDASEEGAPRQVTCLLEIAVLALGIPKSEYVEKRTLALQLSNVMTRITEWEPAGRVRFKDWGQQRAYDRIAA